MTTSKTRVALSLLCCVFFAWGFLTSINSLLVPYAQTVFHLSMTQSMLIQSVFYTSPLLVCLPTVHFLKKVGYRQALIISLGCIALGASFSVWAFYSQFFPLLLWSIFITACGVAMLQVIANPYVVSLGDINTAPQRLTFASTINSLGTTVAPYLTAHLLFSQHSYEHMDAVLYLGVAAAITLLAVTIRLVQISEPMPTTATHELRHQDSSYTRDSLLNHKHLMFGIIGLFCYTGVETSIGSLLVSYLNLYGGLTPASAAKMVTLYWGGAMVGRLIGSVIFHKVNAQYVLIGNTIAAIAIASGVMFFPGQTSAYLLVGVGLCNSIMYPVIFSLAIKDLGTYTEKASGLLIMAGLGGATIPLVQTSLSDIAGLSTSFIVPITCYTFILLYGSVLYKPSRPTYQATA